MRNYFNRFNHFAFVALVSFTVGLQGQVRPADPVPPDASAAIEGTVTHPLTKSRILPLLTQPSQLKAVLG